MLQPQIARFLDNARRFSDVVDATRDWSAASPCAGWSAADVLDHVVDTQRDFLLKRDRDIGRRPQGQPEQVWHQHLDALRRVVAEDDLVNAEYDSYFGRTFLAATFADPYGFELVVHRWDIGRAAGQDVGFSDAEMDALEMNIAGFGETLYMDGFCAPAVPVSQDAPRQQRILAALGRGP